MKTKICFCILIAAFITLPTAQANTSRELMRLQNEIKLLQQQFEEFNNSYNERLDALRSLIIQLNDQVAKSGSTLSSLGMALDNRTVDALNQDRSLLAEIRELSEKIDDASIGISVLAQQLNDFKLQSSMRTIDGPSALNLSPDTMFNQAMRDFILGDFDMAIEGFRAFVEMYPGGDQAARAWLHIGDSHASLQRLRDSVDAYTRVINDYPHTQVVPTALFKRANIEVALQEPSNAIADLRDIIERFPTSAEVELARVELQRLQSAAKPKPATKVPTAKPKR